MICVNENKAQIVKGDFHPAKLYKGDKKIAGYKKETFEGEGTVTLENCYNDKLHNACIFGNSLQESVPSPEEPVEIQSVGDLVTEGEYAGKYKIGIIARNAENLFDKNNMNFRAAYIRAASSQYLNSDDSSSVLIECQPNEIYTIRHSCENPPVFRACYINEEPPTTSGNFYINAYNVIQAAANEKILTVATGEECRYIVVQVSTAKFNEVIETLEVMEGNYIEPQSFDVYLDAPLCKVGNYEDYIDFENKKVIRKTSARAFTGAEGWYRENYRLYTEYGKTTNLNSEEANCISNRFNSYSWEVLYKNSFLTNKKVGVALQGGSYLCVTPAQEIPTVAEWKAQLSLWNNEGAPLMVICADALREEELSLPELPTFRGTTIYEIDTEITAKISGEYKKQEE